MKISPTGSSQSFRGLNFENVSVLDRKMFIHKNELSQLRELGKRYDINLTSAYADIPNFATIEIDVRPLKEGLNFFKRLFRPIGRSKYPDKDNNVRERTIVSATEEAITALQNKLTPSK